MNEELWLALAGSVEPSPRFGGLASQSFELLHRPSDEMFVDAYCDGIQLGAVEDPVVVEPASNPGIDGLRVPRTRRSRSEGTWPVPSRAV